MGYMRHHAIIVSAEYGDCLDKAHSKAVALKMSVSPIVKSPINSVRTFLVAPDGSKEGWDESDIGDRRRAEFIAWMSTQRYPDGSTPLKWAEIQYGDDDQETIAVSHSDEEFRQTPGILE